MLLVLVVGTATNAYAQSEKLSYFAGPTMGTRYSVTIASRGDLNDIKKKVRVRLGAINKLMSTYDSQSEISRFNQYEGIDWFPVSKDTAEVVHFALEVSKATDGAFDPTIGPLVNLWGFGPNGRRLSPPSKEEIKLAQQRVGYHHLEVNVDPPALRKNISNLYVDLSGVAKGYAVDSISEVVRQAGWNDSLIVIGGEVRANGVKPDGSRWRIGIEEPHGNDKIIERTVLVENASVGTSGDWQNAFSHSGKRYSHIIDPKKGWPMEHSLAGVTVLADKSIQSDAWATAIMVMGEEIGMSWCEERGIAAIFFIRPEGKTISTRTSTHFAKRFVP